MLHTKPTALEQTGATLATALSGLAKQAELTLSPTMKLSAAMASYDNECSARVFALEAIGADRAAFWRTTDHNNAVGGHLCDEANTGADIVAHLTARQFGRPAGFVVKHGLDVLIPLNRKATSDLLAAYEAFGEWRSAGELEARVTRKAVV